MNRRTLLAGGSGLALTLAGCRGKDDDSEAGAPVSETSRRGDVELLRELLDVKQRARAEYARGDAPDGLADLESDHVRRLTEALRKRGDRPRAEAEPGDGRADVDRLIDVEDTSIAVLIDVIPKFGDPELRTLAAQMLVVEAQQLALLREAAGFPSLAGPFIYGRRAL